MARKAAPARPRFFATPAAMRRWLEKNHSTADELWVGFYKRHTGRPSITHQELVDELLCFGWIDGLAKSIDDASWMIRVTPRRARSVWSAVNIKRAKELERLGRMTSGGLEAFGKRTSDKSAIYSYEQRTGGRLDPPLEKRFRANAKAWEFFQAQPPGYRRMMTWYVVSAKQDATRERRLDRLIEWSAAGKRIEPMKRVRDS
jgi:uncharacterized protein YdeI (YjbR/CyaY-like superfamily)